MTSRALPLALLMLPSLSLAESLADLPQVERMLPESDVYVDILDASSEVIVYTGDRDADVYGPGGEFQGTFVSGATITPAFGDGAYLFDFDRISYEWSLEVPGRVGGRVWSPDWRFDAGTFRRAGALDRSFYALVNGGAAERDSVIEMVAGGFAGFVFRISGTRTGLPRANGRSLVDEGQVYGSEYPIYLEPPEIASLNPSTASVSAADFTGSVGECDVIAAGASPGVFTFESNVEGTWHLICDLNRDGVFNMAGDEDMHRLGEAVVGANSIEWNGTENGGALPDPGTYDCIVRLTVGEFHFVGDDVETVFPGIRMFEMQSLPPTASWRPLDMYWNDTALLSQPDLTMPNGLLGLVSSGPSGINSGEYTAESLPNTNSRAWGRFRQGSKGDDAWTDTYTFLGSDDSEIFEVSIRDGIIDSDGDTLTDVEEECDYGTDPDNPDTDGDGLSDDAEVLRLPSDPLEADTDGDSLLDGDELTSEGQLVDSDRDGVPDVLDPDDDNDELPTRVEVEIGGIDDFDGDGRLNHLDQDADGDAFRDGTEGIGDRDADGAPDFLDPDTTGLGQLDPDLGYYAGGCSTQGGSGAGFLGLGLGLLALRRRRR